MTLYSNNRAPKSFNRLTISFLFYCFRLVWFGLVFFASVFFLKLIVNSLIYKIIFNFIVYLYEREEEREREIEYFYFGSSFTFHFCKFHIVEHTLYDDCLCSTFARFFSFSVVSVFAAHYFDFNRSSKHFAILLLRIFHQRQSFHLLHFPRLFPTRRFEHFNATMCI